jgi:ectoine hydroxylase-related dioxygenase (phytanoyl-CoA dioxygenase family)
MPELVRRPADTDIEEICEIVARDGAMILESVFDAGRVDGALAEIRPYVDATPMGRDDFSGRCTTRTGALVARSPACREMILQPTILSAARRFLAPWCERIQLHLSQVIRIAPGQSAQPIHRDRWAWGTHLDRLEPQFNTIWALTPFTRENGATRVVPGSVDWPDARQPEPGEIEVAEMAAGSVLLYSGAVFHGGGANASEADRIGVNLTYALGWLRQEENQYLSCPPEIARGLDPELQDLLGYTLGSYALGYYTPPLPPGAGPETVGPEHALGRGEGDGGARVGSEALYEAVANEVAQRGAPARDPS